MAYVTRNELESFSGMSYTDFKIGGTTMTESQWVSFLDVMLPNVEQALNRYCNVTSFDCTTYFTPYFFKQVFFPIIIAYLDVCD